MRQRGLPHPGGSPKLQVEKETAMTTQSKISQGAVFGVEVSGGARVLCLDGEIWVTGPGIGDRVLSPGQSTRVTGPGRVVVQAFRASRVCIGDEALSLNHRARSWRPHWGRR